MAMTVAEFRKWLETQDQGAIVDVVEHTSGGGYYCQGGEATTAAFDPDKHIEYTDFRGNRFVSPEAPHYNQRLLLLGVHDG